VKSQNAYDQLVGHFKQTIALNQISGLLSWDQETMMPKAGMGARAEQSAVLAAVIHNRNIDPKIAEWCADIDEAMLDDVQKANVREALRSHQRAIKIPEKLAEELARSAALGQNVWVNARKAEDVAVFLPALENIVSLKRQEAKCLQTDGASLYDGLLEEFEPGMGSAELVGMFDQLRPQLISLREALMAEPRLVRQLAGNFSADKQMELASRLAQVFNYDLTAGRMDQSVHPFSSGYRSDSRITTRVDIENPFDCIYSTIHEIGHANYEQGRSPEMDLTPAGGYASMGIHESQSRMLENQIGRSRPFMEWLYPMMVQIFGDIGLDSPQELFDLVNQVSTGFIRTEADEIHYNLHVLLRFDLEQAMFAGDLQVKDLEAAWNDRFFEDFGLAVDKPSNGLLQDVHWSFGAFGYFPTYTLGNIYAGELYQKMSQQIPNLEEQIDKGELEGISRWVRENIHRHGNVYKAPELMEKVCGRKPQMDALVDYLRAKFV